MIDLIKVLRRIYKANYIGSYSPLVSHEIREICDENNIDITLLYMEEDKFQRIVNEGLLEYYITK